MSKVTENLLATLKSARRSKGLTQRTLGELVGIPQSHLSRIESGAVDLQASNLIELARALDLELVLMPRQMLPTLNALRRDLEQPSTTSTLNHYQTLARLHSKAVRATQTLEGPARKASNELLDFVRVARVARPDSELAEKLAAAFKEAEKHLDAVLRHRSAAKNRSAVDRFIRALDSQRGLRNQLMHQAENRFSDQVPAYQLPDNGRR